MPSLRHFSAKEKIRIVLEGLRGEDSVAELCRRVARPCSSVCAACSSATAIATSLSPWSSLLVAKSKGHSRP